MIGRVRMVFLAALLAGCAAPLREAPATDPAPRAPSSSDGGQTIVGHVGSDGAFEADTLTGVQADTVRVDRVTVLTGAIRAPSGEPPAAPAPVPSAAPATDPPGEPPVSEPETPREPPVSLMAGFRVQVFAARDESEAAAAARDVEMRVPDVPVYVAWDEPWHKVRLGDFFSRDAAEPLRLRLVELGFAEAWTVPSAVRAPR